MKQAGLLFAMLALAGCAHSSHIETPSLSGAVDQNKQIDSHVKAAQKSVNTVLKDHAMELSAPALLQLKDAQGNLTEAGLVIAAQADQLKTKQVEVDKAVEQGNKAIGERDNAIKAKDAMEPKHKRDLIAMAVLFILGSGLALAGPLIREGYLPLQIIPPAVAGLAASIAGGIVLAGLVGLMALFGVL